MSNPAAPPAISCANCAACCCRLEVMLMGEDDIPVEYTREDQWGGWVMLRLDDGWCAALDRNTLRCTIYPQRPTICRDYPAGDSDCLEERSRYNL
ncbi:MAG: YkgJ family cysteine cluster protein [Rhodocyclaceae bacterium]|nr:YkgJ family cysteine cluster protein [Rhodocyclaceae bacterium]